MDVHLRTLFAPLLVIGVIILAASGAQADPVTFTTNGVFSVSNSSTVTFGVAPNTTTITFNGIPVATPNSVNTPAGAQFGDLVVTTTVPPNAQGPTILGTFTLNIVQVSPPGAGSLTGTLSGTLGFNTGVATLSFSTTSVNIGGFTYTVNPSYTIALPETGSGGGAGVGTTTIQGVVTGSAIPEPTSMMLLGTGLLGLAGAARRKFRSSK